MTTPKAICSPPKPAARKRSPAIPGSRREQAPRSMNPIPIRGTARTEKAPAVTTPTPYNSNQSPGRTWGARPSGTANPPRSASATVRTAPARIAGRKPRRNFRAGMLRTGPGSERRRIFRSIVSIPRLAPMHASPSQTISHRKGVGCWLARAAAPSAVTPTATSPHPGTSVNDAAPSIVRRMKERSWIARSCRAGGSRRSGEAMAQYTAGREKRQALCVIKHTPARRPPGPPTGSPPQRPDPGGEECFRPFRIYWLAEAPPLAVITPELQQELVLPRGLDPLRDHRHPERLAEGDDGPDDLRVLPRGAERADERPVDLECVEPEPLQV